ncbi:uncharacterized protein J3D65DRAFT_669563 [Phyllosticta citribraziliensis]|uniref:C2H2-type domain-containing protein n=1 Tax=Phyllosticta citribraziliensis TaxID=989973 RepID=A0ABR1LF39_9PEZI
MLPTHAEPINLDKNEHENMAATRDSPGEAPDPGTKANAGEVKAMSVSVMAIAQEEEGATNSEADGDTKDEDEQETDNEEGEDDGEQDTDCDEGGDKDDNDNDDEQVPSNSATARDAAKKARKRAWYLRNREKLKLRDVVAREKEYKEVQQLCAALAVKRNKPTNSTDDQETIWLRCPICGTSKTSERALVMHQRKEYVGEKSSQKRKDARAEAGMWVDYEAEQEKDEEAEQEKYDEAGQEKYDEAELWKDKEAKPEKDEEAELEKEQ